MKSSASCLLFALTLVILSACGQGPGTPSAVNTTDRGVAIYGYDPVAYFLEEKPVQGNADQKATWNGADWHFSSPEHKALFIEKPEKYAPQFGGYCAYGISQNTAADIDPNSWTIVDGKLYLNLNADVQNLWRSKRDSFIRAANTNWPEMLKQK